MDYGLTPEKADKQFRRALERSADGVVVAKVKNLKTREEKVVPPASIATAF